jgi:hypothetical protein
MKVITGIFVILIFGPAMLLVLSVMAVFLTGMLLTIFGTILNGSLFNGDYSKRIHKI